MTQCEMILKHLEENHSITSAEAMELYGVFRLASRISDLKKEGVPVQREMVHGTSRYGSPISWARYYLVENEDG